VGPHRSLPRNRRPAPLLRQFREKGAGFGALYLDFLRRGSTAAPRELVLPRGIDLSDPGFYEDGLNTMEGLVKEAERKESAIYT
jgi:oligoendopeptidase F